MQQVHSSAMTDLTPTKLTRVRLHWSYVAEALAVLRENSQGEHTATIVGNFPVIDCLDPKDAELITSNFRDAKLIAGDA